MAKHLIVVEDAKDWPREEPEGTVLHFRDYLLGSAGSSASRIVNLCRGYAYQGNGYYCSLMAEARGQRTLPTVRTISDLSRRALYSLDLDMLNHRLKKLVGAIDSATDTVTMRIFFGQSEFPGLEELGREVFELLPAPILSLRLHKGRKWRIDTVRAIGPQSLKREEQERLVSGYDAFTSRSWRRRRVTPLARFDLAMLVNPREKLPPSNKTALNNFTNAGRQLGIAVDTIEHKDFGRLAEYDGLFIRETTQVDHPTYRFAKKAESEGMVVIDDPTSILRCTNKIFLADLLRANQVPMPRYKLLSRDVSEPPADQIGDLSYPVVVKIPDGSFSRGVVKAVDAEGLRRECQELFKRSSVLLAQEYVYTDYDWRVGILNRTPIFAARYFMSKGHWQIYKHGAGGRVSSGESETLLVERAPAEVIQSATRAAALIGDGFYGVDLKQAGGRTMVIEVNDNPSVDAGYEDAALGKELYRIVMQEFLRRLQQRVSRSDRPAPSKSQTAG